MLLPPPRFSLFHSPLFFTLLFCSGCGSRSTPPAISGATPKTAPAAKAPSPPPPAAPLPEDFRGQTPALSHAAILGVIPSNTLALAVAKSPASLLLDSGAVSVLREYPKFFASANLALSPDGKTYLLEPETWSAMGVDGQAPVGAALVLLPEPVGLLAFTIANPETFRAGLAEIAQRIGLGAVAWSASGDFQIAHFGESSVALLLGKGAALVLVAQRAEYLETTISRAVEGAGVLADNAAESFSQFDFGEDLAGFVALDQVAAAMVAMENRRGAGESYWNQNVRELEEQIDDAQSSGRSSEQIKSWERRLDDALRYARRRDLEYVGFGRFLDEGVSKLGTLVWGVDLAGPETRLRFRVQPIPGSQPDRILAAASARSPLRLPQRLQHSSLFMLAAHLAPQSRDWLLELILNFARSTTGELRGLAKTRFGLDLGGLLAAADGEVSGALTLDLEHIGKGSGQHLDILGALGAQLFLGLRDASGAQRLMSDVAHHLGQWAAGVESGELEFPFINATKQRLRVHENYLEMRTSLGANESGAGGTGPGPQALWRAGLWTTREKSLLSAASNIVAFSLSPIALAWLGLSAYSQKMMPPEELVLASAEDLSKLDPKSRKKAEALRKARRLEDTLRALRRKDQDLISAQVFRSMQQFGRLTVVLRPEPGGFAAIIGSLSGGTAPNLAKAFQGIVEMGAPWLEDQRLGGTSQRWKIRSEIRKLREEKWSKRAP